MKFQISAYTVTQIDLRDTNQFATLQTMCMHTFNAFNGYVILIV